MLLQQQTATSKETKQKTKQNTELSRNVFENPSGEKRTYITFSAVGNIYSRKLIRNTKIAVLPLTCRMQHSENKNLHCILFSKTYHKNSVYVCFQDFIQSGNEFPGFMKNKTCCDFQTSASVWAEHVC